MTTRDVTLATDAELERQRQRAGGYFGTPQLIGQPGGFATLDDDGKIPLGQLPAGVGGGGGDLPVGADGQLLGNVAGTPVWVDPPTVREVPPGGLLNIGKVLTVDGGGGYGWATPGGGAALPAGGVDGQVLGLAAGDPAWVRVREVPYGPGSQTGRILVIVGEDTYGWQAAPPALPPTLGVPPGSLLAWDFNDDYTAVGPKWVTTRQVPYPDPSQQGRVLTVQNNESYGWQPLPPSLPAANTGALNWVLSLQADNGLQAQWTPPARAVPYGQASDTGRVLTVTGEDTYGWQAAPTVDMPWHAGAIFHDVMTTQGPTAGHTWLQLYPMLIPNGCTISALSVVCTGAAAGAQVSVGVYSDENNRAADLLFTTVHDAASTGVKQVALAAPYTVPGARRVWVAWSSTGGGAEQFLGLSSPPRNWVMQVPTNSSDIQGASFFYDTALTGMATTNLRSRANQLQSWGGPRLAVFFHLS